MDIICLYNTIEVSGKTTKEFSLSRLSVIYISEEFHMSIHTFPENNSLAFEFCTFRNNIPFRSIFEFLIEAFDADRFSSHFNIIES